MRRRSAFRVENFATVNGMHGTEVPLHSWVVIADDESKARIECQTKLGNMLGLWVTTPIDEDAREIYRVERLFAGSQSDVWVFLAFSPEDAEGQARREYPWCRPTDIMRVTRLDAITEEGELWDLWQESSKRLGWTSDSIVSLIERGDRSAVKKDSELRKKWREMKRVTEEIAKRARAKAEARKGEAKP